jgi:hypothetical protein
LDRKDEDLLKENHEKGKKPKGKGKQSLSQEFVVEDSPDEFEDEKKKKAPNGDRKRKKPLGPDPDLAQPVSQKRLKQLSSSQQSSSKPRIADQQKNVVVQYASSSKEALKKISNTQ